MLSRFHITFNFHNLGITVHQTGKNIQKYGISNYQVSAFPYKELQILLKVNHTSNSNTQRQFYKQ
jgi:hypothetical protein